MSKRLLGIGDVYTYDYKQVHKTRNVGFGYYDPNKVSTTSSTDGYVLVDGVLSVVNEDGSSEPGPGPEPSLPPFTLRLKFKDGVTPTFSKGTGTLVDVENNIWDLTYENINWGSLLSNQSDLLEVLVANTSNVTQMGTMFYLCTSLTSVALFDTSNVTNMNSTFSNCTSLITVPLFDTSNVKDMWGMFLSCSSLTAVPLFNTSNVTDMRSVFRECRNVQSGALALYQQASTQANPPSDHSLTFRNCGSNTQTGAAELAQIPSDWK